MAAVAVLEAARTIELARRVAGKKLNLVIFEGVREQRRGQVHKATRHQMQRAEGRRSRLRTPRWRCVGERPVERHVVRKRAVAEKTPVDRRCRSRP